MDAAKKVTDFLTWARVCRANPGTDCFYRIPEIRGTEGLTSYPLCRKDGPCTHRTQVDIKGQFFQIDNTGKKAVIASFKYKKMKKSSELLLDILPMIIEKEMQILFTWARDYTRRGIPWMVTMSWGWRIFTLWKHKRV